MTCRRRASSLRGVFLLQFSVLEKYVLPQEHTMGLAEIFDNDWSLGAAEDRDDGGHAPSVRVPDALIDVSEDGEGDLQGDESTEARVEGDEIGVGYGNEVSKSKIHNRDVD